MDQLLVALDVDTRERALELADLLRGTGGFAAFVYFVSVKECRSS